MGYHSLSPQVYIFKAGLQSVAAQHSRPHCQRLWKGKWLKYTETTFWHTVGLGWLSGKFHTQHGEGGQTKKPHELTYGGRKTYSEPPNRSDQRCIGALILFLAL